jgi:hypothetical protein
MRCCVVYVVEALHGGAPCGLAVLTDMVQGHGVEIAEDVIKLQILRKEG